MSDKVVVRSSGGGIGFCGVLTILFIALKLLNQITWSWWWVLSPIWIPLVIIFVVLLVIGSIMLFVARKRY
jgi:hypothetical protein